MAGSHDYARRRRAQRRGRERGCWVYIPGEQLERLGFAPGEAPPWYRVFDGLRGTALVRLYRKP